jgi:hypothetical protein
MKRVSRLQINRLIKKLDDIYKIHAASVIDKPNEEPTSFVKKININDLCKTCDMNSSTVVNTLRQCQAEKLVVVNQPYPISFNVRVLNSAKESPYLKKVLDGAKKSSGMYRVSY